MKDPILESLNKIREIESKEILNEAAAAPVAAASKGIGRFIPGVGAALGAYDAYGRAKQGDWKGAGLSALGGAAALIPGIGTAASLGIAGAQAMRDKQRTGSYMPGDDEIAAGVAKDTATQPAQATAPAAPTVAGTNPKVLALQQQLIAKGAKIKADGVMGPATQTAMKQFPDVRMAETTEQKGIEMSESERIAKLRDRLSQIESSPQTEGLADLAKGAYQGIKTVGKNLAGGARGDKARTAAGTYAAKKSAAGVANTVGKTAAANKGKIGLATGAVAGAAAAPAISNMASTTISPPTSQAANPAPATTAPATTAPATTAPATTAPATNDPDPADIAELNRLAAELETSNDPEDIAILQRYNGVINAINNRAAGDKRTQGEIAAGADLSASGL